MRKVNAKAIARPAREQDNENGLDTVALWSAALWVAALLYLLATLGPIH